MMAFTRFATSLLIAALPAVLAVNVATADEAQPVPPTPAPVVDIISVQPFTLEQSTTHFWRAERPSYRSGYLLVLKVDPAYVIARQIAEPVLYVDDQTAERVNHGEQSGHVVAIVPAVLDDATHIDAIDLSKALIWFGTPDLPERVDTRAILAERRAAKEAGIGALPAARLTAARARGGATLDVTSKRELLRAAGRLVERYAPEDERVAERLR